MAEGMVWALRLLWALLQGELTTGQDFAADLRDKPQSCGVSESCVRTGEFQRSNSNILLELGCPENEPSLDKALAYWENEEKLHPKVFNEFCMRLPANQINAGRVAPLYAFHVVLYKHEVYMSCCDTHISCESLLAGELRNHRDLRESIGVLQELLTIMDIDMQFLLAFGDEPFTSQVLYSNVPLFHPSGSESHWTIPWPSIYHIRALLNGLLDNDTLVSESPWQNRKPQLWWRGSMIAPSTTLLTTAHFHPKCGS